MATGLSEQASLTDDQQRDIMSDHRLLNILVHGKFKMNYLLRPFLIVLLFIVAALLGNRLFVEHDMTNTQRNTLLPQTLQTLQSLPHPVTAEVFINPQDQQREAIATLLDKYQAGKSDFTFSFTDPALDPSRMRSLGIAPGGEIFFTSADRTQRISEVSEQAVTMALQRLARESPRVAAFVTGHGERHIEARNNADISTFATQLRESGFNTQTIRLTDPAELDPQSDLLVIASPLQRFLPAETAMLLDYLSQGGNMVWLTEPFSDDGLKAIEFELGVRRLPGVVVDLAAQKLQVDRPDFAIANNYSQHLATQGFSSVTLFPQAAGLELQANREWRAAALVQAGEQAWTETGSLSGEVAFGDDNREISGPFPLILALERQRNGKTQKVLISGDGDFIADAWIDNGGNRDLGNRLFNWGADDNNLISVQYPTTPKQKLELTPLTTVSLFLFALIALPGGLFGAATRVWFQRRHG